MLKRKRIGILTILVFVTIGLGKMSYAAVPSDSLKVAISLIDKGEFEEAGRILYQLNKTDPADPEVLYHLGRVNLFQGKIDSAVKQLEGVVKLNPKVAKYHLGLGEAYGQKAQKANVLQKLSWANKCKKEFMQAIELEPQNAMAHYALAQYYLQAPSMAGGNKDKGKEELIKAIDHDPQNPQFRLSLGLQYLEEKMYEKALEQFRKLKGVDTQNYFYADYQMCKVYIAQGENLKEAERIFQEFLKRTDLDKEWKSGAHFRLGQVYEKMGKKELAEEEWKKALEIDPENRKAKEALKKVKK